MIDGIADHVGNGIGQFFDDGLVHFGLIAGGHEPHFPPELGGNVPDEPRHARENRADRLHADRHHAFLQLSCLGREFFAALGPLAALAAIGHLLGEHGLGDDEFADHVHQPVDAAEVHADGGCAFGGGSAGAGMDGRGSLVCRWAGRSFHRRAVPGA